MNEDLLEFAEWVATQVCVSDDDWDMNEICFQEIACRKLVKLGIIQESKKQYFYNPKPVTKRSTQANDLQDLISHVGYDPAQCGYEK